jgi:hypothetical protein
MYTVERRMKTKTYSTKKTAANCMVRMASCQHNKIEYSWTKNKQKLNIKITVNFVDLTSLMLHPSFVLLSSAGDFFQVVV